MIMSSLGQIRSQTAHDHGSSAQALAGVARLGEAKWRWWAGWARLTMRMSMLSAVGERVEALRLAIPRLCLSGGRDPWVSLAAWCRHT